MVLRACAQPIIFHQSSQSSSVANRITGCPSFGGQRARPLCSGALAVVAARSRGQSASGLLRLVFYACLPREPLRDPAAHNANRASNHFYSPEACIGRAQAEAHVYCVEIGA
jgi:hypothetical protein